MTCTNARDTITQDAGRVLANHFDYSDTEHVVTSQCRTTDGTWVAWKNVIFGDYYNDDAGIPDNDPNKADWPARVASATAVGVGFFPDDGSGPIVYELGVDPVFTWTNLPTGRGETECGYWFVVGDVFEDWGKPLLTGWSMNVLDVQVRTDGFNVWVVVLAQESVKYPYLYLPAGVPGRVDRCGVEHETMGDLWFGRGEDAFIHDFDVSGYFWYYGSGALGGDMFMGPYDDAGDSLSLRWSPARVTVFGGDIGGFTKLDTVDAKFRNLGDTGLTSGIEAAASPAEPGVLHVLWAEGGDFGSKGVSEMRGQRITYSRWSPTANILESDLLYEEADGYGTTDDPALTYVPDDQFIWTAEMILRNDHGSPIAFVWPWIADGGPQQPDPAIQVWDLSSGSITLLQTLDPSLVPTPAEAGLGVVTPAGSLGDPAAAAASNGTMRRSQFASSLYIDPTLSDRHVYLLCAVYQDGSESAVAFYRIPCDGSDTFDFMDGKRAFGYSIVNNGGGFIEPSFGSDFVSDPDNVWIPAAINAGGAIMHLFRRCTPTWELLPAFPVPDPTTSGYEDGLWGQTSTSPPTVVTDDAGDWVAGAGYGPILPITSSDPVEIAALRAKICRCCVPCGPVGIRLWKTVS